MEKKGKSRRHRQKYKLPSAGSSPGLVYIDDQALQPRITLHQYNQSSYLAKELDNLNQIKQLISDQNYTYWIEIKGFNSEPMFETIYRDFKVNKLVLEDITRTYQRPKLEEYEGYIFAVSRMLMLDEEKNLGNEQLSYILTNNTLITLQEAYQDCLEPVRQRLKAGKGNIRTSGSSYLFYALNDTIIDTYFEILGVWSEELDNIEDRLFEKPDRTIMFDTQLVKRNIISIRRVAWPERDKLNDILRTDNALITDTTKMFIRDAYDHCIQIIDLIESLKEISASNIDMYLSIISNRMNQIMKVLTIISSIFIPLTFIAGIYGMNFAKEDPVTGKLMPYNMPELYQSNGYLITILVMLFIAILQVLYFWRKGWFK